MKENPADLLWASTVDGGQWHVAVYGSDEEYKGVLSVEDSKEELVHRQIVPVSYDAVFGPDVSDIEQWANQAIDVIDNPDKRSILELDSGEASD